MLGGPWRLTEPCDVTVGGATWLDQAQETAARTRMRVHTGGRWGNRELHQSIRGRVPYRTGEATDSCRSTQERNRAKEPPTNSNKYPNGSGEKEEMQGEAWDCRQEGLKQTGSP